MSRTGWKIGLAVMLAVLGAVPALAADRYWAVGDGDWDTTSTNWATAYPWAATVTFTDGDRVYFSGSVPANRQLCDVNIVSDVAPGFLQVQNGYGCVVSLSGADITGTLDMQVDLQNELRFLRAFSFTGAVILNGSDAGNNAADFHFQPTVASTLTQGISVPSGKYGMIGGNSNADWSSCNAVIADGGGITIPATGNTAAHYTGLVLQPAGDMTLSLTAHYQTANMGCFNGKIDGSSSYVTLNGHTGVGWWGVIRGPGNWDILGLVKDTGFDVDVYASNICGASLSISAGRLRLQTGTEQLVTALTIGGVTQSDLGTYGSTASGADYPNDTYFLGDGVVRLEAPTVPEVSITASDASATEATPATDPGQFTFTRDTTSGDLAVNYVVSGTAAAGDYSETLGGSITISNGNTTATIDITPVDDGDGEQPETVTLTVTADAAYTITGTPSGTVTIADNDAFVPTVALTASDAWAAEPGPNPGEFTVTRDDTSGNLVVNYTVGGTATPADYDETLGSVVIPDGSASTTITITPTDESDVEPLETVILELTPDADYLIGSPSNGTVRIGNDDGAAANRYLALADGDWDTTSVNWADQAWKGREHTYRDGDTVYVSGGTAAIRTFNTINIVGSVAPAHFEVQSGYGTGASLQGGDITGSLNMQVGNQNSLEFKRAFSFNGTITVGIHATDPANFYFRPSAPATLTQAVTIPAGKTARVYGNANANWSGSTFTLGAGADLRIPSTGGVVSHYSGLVVTMAGNANLHIDYNYQDSGRGCFNGQFDGSDHTLTMSEPAQASNRKNYITGPGNWNIASLIFNYPGFKCDIRASNICGDSLNLQDGIMILAAGTVQEVSSLTITGVVKTAYGTYGSAASGADHPIDSHFEGLGVVHFPPPSGTVVLIR